MKTLFIKKFYKLKKYFTKMCCLIALSTLVSTNEIDLKPYKDLANVLGDYPGVSKTKVIKEHFYFPYWDKGHWVFNRVKLRSTERPLGNFLNKGESTKHMECNQICLGIYKTYGEVCAQRFVTRSSQWKYEYKEFENMCYLEYENCKNENKHWYPIHKGTCPEFRKMTKNPTHPSRAVKRIRKWERRIKNSHVGVGLEDVP